MDLDDWRRSIDALNLQLVEILNVRAGCALAIAELKQQKNLPVYDPVREKQVLNAVLAGNKGPLSNDAVLRIFACIIAEHRLLEESAG